MELLTEITENAKIALANKQKDTTDAFVTLSSQNAKHIILNYNEEDLSSKLRNFIMCCTSRNKLLLR